MNRIRKYIGLTHRHHPVTVTGIHSRNNLSHSRVIIMGKFWTLRLAPRTSKVLCSRPVQETVPAVRSVQQLFVLINFWPNDWLKFFLEIYQLSGLLSQFLFVNLDWVVFQNVLCVFFKHCEIKSTHIVFPYHVELVADLFRFCTLVRNLRKVSQNSVHKLSQQFWVNVLLDQQTHVFLELFHGS